MSMFTNPVFTNPVHPVDGMSPDVGAWYEHIRVLTEEIGPRGSTTEGERRGAEYCRQVFDRLGYHAEVEEFVSARSIFEPHLWAAVLMFAAFVIYPLAGQASAALAALVLAFALVSDLMELGFRNNFLRRLVSKGSSQNVIALADPAGANHGDLILIGHIDSPRTPIIFSSERWLGIYKVFSTAAFAVGLIQVPLYLLGIFFRWAWIWPASAAGAAYAAALIAVYTYADHTPFNVGANDNASSVGLVLALAERLQAEPLRHTRVWLVCTGCEEVQHYGAADFFRRHRRQFVAPRAIAFEMLGCGGPTWMQREGIVIPFRAHGELVELAERVAAEHPELHAHALSVDGGNTEMADALLAGVPAIALTGIRSDGTAPFWHTIADTFDNIDPAALERNYTFIWEYVKALDAAR